MMTNVHTHTYVHNIYTHTPTQQIMKNKRIYQSKTMKKENINTQRMQTYLGADKSRFNIIKDH